MKTLDYLHLDASAVSNVVASLNNYWRTTKYSIRTFVVSTGISRDTVSSFFMVNSRICTTTLPRRLTSWRNVSYVGRRAGEQVSEYLKVARVKEVSGVSCGDEALKHILDTYGLLIGEERKLLSLASEAGDEATVALMSDYLKEQEKLVWMLVAYSTCDCKK